MAMHPAHIQLREEASSASLFKLPDVPAISKVGAGYGAASVRCRKLHQFRPSLCVAKRQDRTHDNFTSPVFGFSWDCCKRACCVCVSAAVATAPRTASGEEGTTTWRLDGLLHDIQSLRDALEHTNSLGQKLQILDKNSRVQDVFGDEKMSQNTIISFALENSNEYEIYLLKCLVASGQEHVLRAPSEWLNQFEDTLQNPMDAELESNGNSLTRLDLNGSGKLPSGHRIFNEVIQSTSLSSEERKYSTSGNTRPSCIGQLKELLNILIQTLHKMESFYNSIGGIIGYQATALELIKRADLGDDSHVSEQSDSTLSDDEANKTRFSAPLGPDLSIDRDYAIQAAAWGLQALPEMGEIYPLGGAGDRLGLVDEVTGQCLPVAMLPYCGRTLLEGLIRDLQAREFLYFKTFGKQEIMPVAIMTSAAKKNHELVSSLCESKGWFGRGKSNFFLFEQPLIPAVAAEDGHWLISEPLVPILKPGGHGVIWKLAFDRGVFDWFYKKGRKAAIVRQISNPIAATDVTLLALTGVGHHHNKKFGFASCERKVGAAEGVNVLVERKGKHGWDYSVTCIEYTEFNKLGIPDVPVSPGSMQAQYPANTNVLYVDLPSVERIASCRSSRSLPGMILNLKKPIVYEDYHGVTHRTYAGRVECTMQNVADLMINTFSSQLKPSQHGCLDTFVVYNKRRKVTSSAKKQRKRTDFLLHQTPDGSFLDVIRNAHELLSSCHIEMPNMESVECYLEHGPPFIAILHPAIGPLWNIVQQKITGGQLTRGSELQLEISELFWKDVQLEGSLLVLAENVVGSLQDTENEEKILFYGKGCGKCRLERVTIQNKGVDWNSKQNVYWQHKVSRLESLTIILHGHSEFEAQDVHLQGSVTFEVPDGFRMRVTQGDDGIKCDLHPLPSGSQTFGSWQWRYTLQDGGYVQLDMQTTVEN
ncbi:hypothetical protein KP509_34G009000 [Ceratopteris richardii]|uniref:UGP3-like C-terminal hexapeptide repeats domain-containing protein n=2 Tax=Ceratopteris richardii TaxID=49495 RepID=A0A8T2QIQ9_CERRI|nr:hypothetical protein KP509_34G009000 [Ceratopteris richardii]